MKPIVLFSVLIYFGLMSIAATSLEELPSQNRLTQIDASKNLSQLMRSNAPHFWTWARKRISTMDGVELAFIKPQGIIMGDAHLGNMHPVPSLQAEKSLLIWKNVDLDDAGVGSFALDYLHFVLSVKAINDDIKISDMTEKYLLGLNKLRMPAPESIQEFLDISKTDYEKKRIKHLNKKIEDNKLILDGEDIVKFSEKRMQITISSITEAFVNLFGKSVQILDLASVQNDRGGSANSKRILVLLELNSVQHLYEIKEMSTPGLLYFQLQKNIDENFKDTQSYFGYTDQELALVRLNDALFIIREKKLTLFDVPYEQENKQEKAFLKDLAEWGAYNLGLWHARNNPQSAAYAKLANKKTEEFIEFIKSLRKEYLAIVLEQANF